MTLSEMLGRSLLPGRRVKRLVRRANAANAARRWAEAERLYAAALKLSPERAPLWVQYGHALKEQGFLAQATEAYLRAARLRPAVADTHLQLGHVLRLQGRPQPAIAAYEEALRLAPDMTLGRDELGRLRAALATDQAESRSAVGGGDRPAVPDAAPPARDPQAAALSQLLAEHGLTDGLLGLFDPFFYRLANPEVRKAVPEADLAACLRHFCTTGIDRMLRCSPDFTFDPAFYRETSLGGMAFTPANAYRHWLTVGMAGGAAPERRVWIRNRLLGRVDSFGTLDLVAFAAHTDRDAAGRPWADLAERFLGEAADPARGVVPDDASADLFAALADRLDPADGSTAAAADATRGFTLRQRLAWHVPHHLGNRLAHADALRRRASFAEAAALYRDILAAPLPMPAAFTGLAACQAGLGQQADALATLARARAAHPDEEGLGPELRAQAGRVADQAWQLGWAQARLGRVAAGQALVRASAAAGAAALQGSLPAAPRAIRRIAIAAYRPQPQCRFYRVEQKREQLIAAGFAATVFDLGEDPAAFTAALHGIDAVIFYAVPALPDILDVIQQAIGFGVVTFYDCDDLVFDDAYPDPLETYAGRITREEHIGLALAVPLHEQAMRLCSYGIASTPALAEAMRGRVRSGRVFLHPNALGTAHRRTMAAYAVRGGAGARPVTIFYGSGTRAHRQAFATLVEPALLALLRRHGAGVAIVLMGDFVLTPALAAARNVSVIAPVWDIETYWRVLAAADINLAVLAPSRATDAKSEIKWLEAAMLGIPSVVSDTATHRAVIRPGESGLLCRSPADWAAALDRLVRDPALRARIGAAARRQALAEYGADAMARRAARMLAEVSPPADPRPLVLIVAVFYPPQAIGGATRVVHDNLRALAGPDSPFRFEVFTTIRGGPAGVLRSWTQDGVRVTGIGTGPEPVDDRPAEDPRMGEVFAAFLRQARPALVHFHCIQRLTAAVVAATAAAGLPYVITVHDGWWISGEQFLLDRLGRIRTYDLRQPLQTLRSQGQAAYQRLVPLRRALLGARQVMAVSEPFAALYRDAGVAGVMTTENGVAPLPEMARRASPDGRIRLGFVGGLARHKGFDLVRLAVAARPYRNLRLILVDHGRRPGDVRREMWGSVPVEYRAMVPQAEVAGLYAEIDVLLAPSLWPESFGLVTREALLAGCWVVASDRGAIGACVEPGRNGFVIDVATADGLIAALTRIDAAPAQYGAPPPGPRPIFRAPAAQAREIAACYEALLEMNPAGITRTEVRDAKTV